MHYTVLSVAKTYTHNIYIYFLEQCVLINITLMLIIPLYEKGKQCNLLTPFDTTDKKYFNIFISF